LPSGRWRALLPLAAAKAAPTGRSRTGHRKPRVSFQQRASSSSAGPAWKDGIAKGAAVTIMPLADALDQIEGGSKIQVK
jgi:hypothetical protein